jgi:serine/threonine protein kinase
VLSGSVGPYELLGPLGSGGMGDVYKAQRNDGSGFGRELALKVMRSELAHDPRFEKLFFREGRALAALNDPGIVRVIELRKYDDRLCLAMELLVGLSVRHLLKRAGILQWQSGAYLGARAASALIAAHELSTTDIPMGLIHGDLSPSNIMVCDDGAVKLLDFGLARPADREKSTSRIEGKLQYMPPEAITGAQPAMQADIYALGVILYEVLTGSLPFSTVNELATLHDIQFKRVPPPSKIVEGIPAEFDDLVLACISRDIALRPTSARDVAGQLESILGNQFSTDDMSDLVTRARGDATMESPKIRPAGEEQKTAVYRYGSGSGGSDPRSDSVTVPNEKSGSSEPSSGLQTRDVSKSPRWSSNKLLPIGALVALIAGLSIGWLVLDPGTVASQGTDASTLDAGMVDATEHTLDARSAADAAPREGGTVLVAINVKARVYLDEKLVKRATKTAILKLPDEKKHTIKVVANRYHSVSHTVQVLLGASKPLEIELKRLRTKTPTTSTKSKNKSELIRPPGL